MINFDEILRFNLDERIRFQEVKPTDTTNATENIQQENHVSQKFRFRKQQTKFQKALWTLQENLRYASFLQKNRQFFECSLEKRRALKINHLLSQAVTSRSSTQCRSHHQKMLKHHKNISGIIRYIKHLQEFRRRQSEIGEIRSSFRIGKKQLISVVIDEIMLSAIDLESNIHNLQFPQQEISIDHEYE